MGVREELVTGLKNGKVLVVVGTGVSQAATDNNPEASWIGLLKSGVQRAADFANPRVDAGWKDRVLGFIEAGENGRLDDLLLAAEAISMALGGPRHVLDPSAAGIHCGVGPEYRDWLKATVGSLRAKNAEVLDAVVTLGCPLATTNYDQLLEDASRLPPVTWLERSKVLAILRGEKAAVLHLHGFWDRPGSIVLGIRSYESVLGNEHAQLALRTLLTTRSFLFVGVGAGLGDPNFSALLEWQRRVLKEDSCRHFRLATEAEALSLQCVHPAEDRICLLPYGGKHEDLPGFLRGLRASSENRVPARTDVSLNEFRRLQSEESAVTIEGSPRLRNLAGGHWLYDGLLLPRLLERGWARFGAGFKAGIYGHPNSPWCLKVMGMGIGDDPLFFAGCGHHNIHERQMLEAFARAGFAFQPQVMPPTESIRFLIEQCGVDAAQAEWQCAQGNALVLERISGLPLAQATGNHVHYFTRFAALTEDIIARCEQAACHLQAQLQRANQLGLLHNDPVPANIIFTCDSQGQIAARLVDFELAQDMSQDSPSHVTSFIPKQYVDREVPRNPEKGTYTKNLDEHLMDHALLALQTIRRAVASGEAVALARGYSFPGGMRIHFEPLQTAQRVCAERRLRP